MFRAARCSKHVEDRSVTYILLNNKGIVHSVGNLKKSPNVIIQYLTNPQHQVTVAPGNFIVCVHYFSK